MSTDTVCREPFGPIPGQLLGAAIIALLISGCSASATGVTAECSDELGGNPILDGESLANWSIEADAGSIANLEMIDGAEGSGIRMNWDIGTGNWVQAKHTFTPALNLCASDIFTFSLRGGGPGENPNVVAIMFADSDNVFFGWNIEGSENAIHQIDRWMENIVAPKNVLYHFFTLGSEETEINWSSIDRFFLVVKRPSPPPCCLPDAGCEPMRCCEPVTECEPPPCCETPPGGGNGTLDFDNLLHDRAASWSRQSDFESVLPDNDAAASAVAYVLSVQDAGTGIFVSWKEEEIEQPPAKSWLYDQALVLIMLTREGAWENGIASNEEARAAERLVEFLLAEQKADGHWARGWNPRTGSELLDDMWPGDQAWWVMALMGYAEKSGNVNAGAAAQAGAAWLAARIDAEGKIHLSTEANVDTWWSLISTGINTGDADRIKTYLLTEVWDSDLHYWWRGYDDPVVALDTATWVSHFARHPSVRRVDRALAALSFVGRTLSTSSESGSIYGLDGTGPVHIWNEGTAQYVSSGGQNAQFYLTQLLQQQRPDGSMPGSTADARSDAFGWWTTWSGLAPTTWLYFALTGSPFPYTPLSIEIFSDGFESGDLAAW